MHLQYWGLCEAPFSSKQNAEHYFDSPPHAEALAGLHLLVQQNRRLGVLAGAPGTGKSMVLDVLARQLRRNGCFASKLNLMGLDSDEFLWRLASGLGHYVSGETRPVVLWKAIQDKLATQRYQRVTTVLLWDDADECEFETLTAMSRIVQMEQHPDSRLTVVLACRNNRLALLGSRLVDLCELSMDLEPWSLEDTKEYISTALNRSGREALTFSDDALERLHDLANGIPRAVNQLADLCLLVGAGEEISVIDADTVENVQQSFRARHMSVDAQYA
jgi:general secretion pathway protein A